MSNIKVVIATIVIIALFAVVAVQIKEVKDNQVSIINALGSAGILEQESEGADILINPVVRYKDLPQE